LLPAVAVVLVQTSFHGVLSEMELLPLAELLAVMVGVAVATTAVALVAVAVA
jgi:hypothetical protein